MRILVALLLILISPEDRRRNAQIFFECSRKIFDIISDVLSSSFDDIVAMRGNEAGLKFHGLLLKAFEQKDEYSAQQIMQRHMDDMQHDYCEKAYQ